MRMKRWPKNDASSRTAVSLRGAVTIAASVALGALLIPGASFAVDSVKEVVIRNTIQDPVPTRPVGSTTVDGAVRIVNETPIPVDAVDRGSVGGQPVTLPLNLTLSDPTCSGNIRVDQDIYTVPADKQLIVDHVSVEMEVYDAGFRYVRLGVGSAKVEFIPTEVTNPTGFALAVGSDDPHFVVDPGGVLSVHVFNHFGRLCSSQNSTFVTVIGRLVPLS